MKRLLAFFILAFWSSAYGKDVVIEWKEMPNALSYEIEIDHEGKQALKKATTDHKWSGEVDVGFYSYRIRAIDRARRPGIWTEPQALVVMPESPKIISPKNGQKSSIYNDVSGFRLKWQAVEGVSRYHVVVKRGERTVLNQMVSKTSINVVGMGPGQYSWQISSVVAPQPGRAPAAFASKVWESEIKVVDNFSAERDTLEKVAPSFPIGKVMPPDSGKIRFRWDEVEGAEGYELLVYKTPVRGVAAQQIKAKKFFVEKNELTLKLPQNGAFTWQVRAVAHRDELKKAGAVGPTTTTKFVLDSSGVSEERKGYIALSTMFAPYSYKITSYATNTEGTFDSAALTLRLSGEYWFNQKWAIAGGIENTRATVLNQSISRMGIDVVAKYRILLGSGWVLLPKGGLEQRQFAELRPANPALQSFTLFKPTAMGPQLGFDLRKQFSDSFSIGARINYFHPITLSGIEGSMGGGSNFNLNIGVQGLYWISGNWGLGAGGFLDFRRISYTTDAGKLQEVQTDGTYFFGSLIYSFGN